MTGVSLTVSEVLNRVRQVVIVEFPSPIWVRGEVTGYRRTTGGAVFFRLADPEVADTALDVAARGRLMMSVDRDLSAAGLGSLRDGVEVRIRGTVELDTRRSVVRLSLLEVDPTFTAGKLALDRAEVLRRMTADGSLIANGLLPQPLVPLRVGLITSRGSAAHGDFTDQLARSPYRFSIKTVHTSVQGVDAAARIEEAFARLAAEPIDVTALIRGGGSKLDLSVFDSEIVARAVAASPVPVLAGIGHDMDQSVADRAAAISVKTPSAAGEWLVEKVRDYAGRIATARHAIDSEARTALSRHRLLLRGAAADIAGSSGVLRRKQDHLSNIGADIARMSRESLDRQGRNVAAMAEWFSAIGIEPTLRRGFAIVTTADGSSVVKSVDQVGPGERLLLRLADGTVPVQVTNDEH